MSHDNITDPPPLDPAQVVRISAVHRGYLYQHLYVTGCLLTVARTARLRIIVERDEDMEAVGEAERLYVQIKTRGRSLQPADIAEALARFDDLRAEHAAGRREGVARFVVVSNVDPGPVLTKQLLDKAWPADVTLISPGRPTAHGLPPAWPDLDTALAWCVQAAAAAPFVALPPPTLVWKLAALVMRAATGAGDRSFNPDDLPGLLEQLVVRLQDFPEPPLSYRAQADEPSLIANARLRLIVAFSGAGKTAWASQAAIHAPTPVTYFDVGDMPAASVANALARELAARFLGSALKGGGGALLAQSSGLGVLRACAGMLQAQGVQVLVVLDNAHRLSGEDLRRLVDTAEGVRFVCLAQPWPGAAEAAVRFDVEVEGLSGWALDTIAAVFREARAPVTLETAQRIAGLTGGLPLFVLSAARLTHDAYGGDADAFCDAVLNRVHDADTAQDIILGEAVAALPEDAKQAMAALALAETPLSREEALAVLEAAKLSTPAAAAALRALRRVGFLNSYRGDRLSLHDALRPLAAELCPGLGEGGVLAVRERLYQLLSVSLYQARDVPRLSAVLRLMPLVGQAEALAELASDEMFYELGDPRTLREEIDRVAEDPGGSALDRFWAHDALAYWESRDGGVPDGARLAKMGELVDAGQLGRREQLALAFKEMIYLASNARREDLDRTYRRARQAAGEEAHLRLLTYNYGVCLGRLGAWGEVERLSDRLVGDYLRLFGLREQDLFMVNGSALEAMFNKADTTEVKRLADSLALWCTARINTNQLPNLRRIHATKLYAVAQAVRSAVVSGQEAADDFLQLMADPRGALEVMETLVLPGMRAAQLTDLVLPVRSHYAIVLAWLGRVGEARAELNALRQYAGEAEQAAMLAERAAFVEEIAAGRARLVPRVPPPGALMENLRFPRGEPVRRSKVGRNAQCPCGSGRKYKHCHGRTGDS